MKAVALSSGGKDSILALHLAGQVGYKISTILSMIPEDPESMLYHTFNLRHVGRLARSMGMEWTDVPAPKGCEEEAFRRALSELEEETIVTGGISSGYQKRVFEGIATELGKSIYSPLWGMSPKVVFGKINELGMSVIIVAVAALGLGESWLGAHLNAEKQEELLRLSTRYKFDPMGEGGDLDTFVLDSPLYSTRFNVSKYVKKWFGDRGILEIVDLDEVEK